MNIFNISDFGAKSNGELMTVCIQRAIDYCYLLGGGIVLVPKGDFITGEIRLRSHVHLHLEEDAHIIGSNNPQDYFGILNDQLEPLGDDDKSDIRWLPPQERTCFDHLNKCGSRWNNALIRAVDAENVEISGDEGSYIDGCDCFDEEGEEYYRGPHAINFHRCKNIKFKNYVVKNSANWAHAFFGCDNVEMDNVTVEGGHDGVHMRSCTNVFIQKCSFFTGDDCVSGFDNVNINITECIFNTACSGMRFGGRNVLVEGCHFKGPAKYPFRGSLSQEEKRATKGAASGHRYNMLSAFTYFSDYTREIRSTPGNILIKDCRMVNIDRFLHYNFSGNEPWQCNKPLHDITFQNIVAEGITMPLTAYGNHDMPLRLEMINVDIIFDPQKNIETCIRAYGFEKILLKNFRVKNVMGNALIKTWDEEGEILCENVIYDKEIQKLREYTKEAFVCSAI